MDSPIQDDPTHDDPGHDDPTHHNGMTTRDQPDGSDVQPTMSLAVDHRADIADGVADGSAAVTAGWSAVADDDRRLSRASALAGALAGFIPFMCVLWDFGLNPLRVATQRRFASNFYDIQARAFLHGHLAVPPYSLGIEGFVIDGRTYMYFPPFPALLRLPVLLLTDRLDGRLTAPSMLLAWIALAAATVSLIWNVRFLIRGAERVTRLEAATYSVLIASITGGSIVVFQAALPWVYHEAYLWATAFTVATLAGLLAFVRHPSRLSVAFTTACALGAILTRTTSGWAMSLTMMAVAAWVLLSGSARRRRVAVRLLAAGLVTLCTGAIINWAKFRHPYMFPLEHQEWTKTNSRRRLALRMNDGSITGPRFFLTSLGNYFKPNGITFVPYFPFVTMPPEPARSYGGAFLDQWYRTGSIPAFMPLLFGSTLWGFVCAFRPAVPAGLRALRIPLLGALMITGGVMFYGYVAHRYLSEFLPAMVLGSIIGVVDISGRLSRRSSTAKRVAVGAMTLLAAYGGFVNAAVSLTSARTLFQGAPLETYVDWQLRFGHTGSLIVQSDTLPADGPADQLMIVGDCNELYLATGDDYGPWATVQVRDFHVRVKPNPGSFQPGLLPLITFEGLHDRVIILEADGERRVRLRLGEAYVSYPTEWISYEPTDVIDVGVRVDTAVQRFYITVNGEEVGYFASAETDGNRPVTVARPSFALPTAIDQAIAGFTLTPEHGPRLALCDRVLDEMSPPG